MSKSHKLRAEMREAYNLVAPSGATKTIIGKSLWLHFRRQGWDMRWYAIRRPLPVPKDFTIFRKAE
ncbi:hypothetical protein HJA82_29200 [Rhizobium bangladeshense]|uniref:hypothetical protein n=1 Tax=Rhizobium bangladeshense TaxID=1138189 RepID=UPI001C82A010|nr:hypothetical protein [Rhizobium bangladeshense]MBX4911392.1 hypothetical protein [Rhizobium bangladeshense]